MDVSPATYNELLRGLNPRENLGQQACPICLLVQKALRDYLEDLIASFGVDRGARAEMRQARGFCSEHANQLRDMLGVGLGVALIHWDIIETVLEETEDARRALAGARRRGLLAMLRTKGRPDQAAARIAAALEPRRACLGCEHQASVENLYLTALLHYIAEPALAAALEASPGLCLPHFRQALEMPAEPAALARLVEIETACLRRLSAELQVLARRLDHHYRGEIVGAERDAWLRSIDQVSGVRGTR